MTARSESDEGEYRCRVARYPRDNVRTDYRLELRQIRLEERDNFVSVRDFARSVPPQDRWICHRALWYPCTMDIVHTRGISFPSNGHPWIFAVLAAKSKADMIRNCDLVPLAQNPWTREGEGSPLQRFQPKTMIADSLLPHRTQIDRSSSSCSNRGCRRTMLICSIARSIAAHRLQ